MLSINNYNFDKWTNKIDITSLYIRSEWRPIILKYFDVNKDKLIKINNILSLQHDNIVPYPELLWKSFNMSCINDIKVVIIGQDPYFNVHDNIPEAMGLSFSVPVGIPIPSSLNNIFNNAIKYKNIYKKPNHGNLEFWALQGVLLLNSSLTVIRGSDNKNCHMDIWSDFTNYIVKYISDNYEHLVFVLWGAYARDKMNLINSTKHKIIITSHPSGLSVNNKLGSYPSFNSYDHFGEINKYLVKHNKLGIIWQI